MMIQNTKNSFGSIAKCFHWGIAALILVQFSIAYGMINLNPNPFKWTLYDLHKSIGLTILILTGLRLLWRLMNPIPEMPRSSPRWQTMTSQFIFIALYLLLFLIPLSGLGMNLFNGYSVSYFGLFTIPELLPKPTPIGSFFYQMHVFLSYALLICIGVHISAAFYHYFILKDSIFQRMLFNTKGKLQ